MSKKFAAGTLSLGKKDSPVVLSTDSRPEIANPAPGEIPISWAVQPEEIPAVPEMKARLEASLHRAAGLGVAQDQLAKWSREMTALFRNAQSSDSAAFAAAGKLSFIEGKVAELEESIRATRHAAQMQRMDERTRKATGAAVVFGALKLLLALA